MPNGGWDTDIKLREYRNLALRSAKDLLYEPYVLKEIRAAKTADEISKIMTAARHRKQWRD